MLHKIHTEFNDTRLAKVYYDSDLQEYVVKSFVYLNCNWRYQESEDYFTDSREDAIATAKATVTHG